jgi:hypothetical protein
MQGRESTRQLLGIISAAFVAIRSEIYTGHPEKARWIADAFEGVPSELATGGDANQIVFKLEDRFRAQGEEELWRWLDNYWRPPQPRR